ncbi:MAG: glycoside hydrolase family 3 protein [Victivallales bacterium]|nr:glycoside hydrolase family 3 protein [Victivallales bacterium]
MKKHTAKSLEQQIEKLLAKLTLDEKLCLIRGRTDSHTGDVPRLGIQGIHTSDGPQGIRLEDGRTTTALPCGQSLSCTFSPKSAEKAGRLLGRECRALGVQALLGPGMNLMRTPLNGRSFEYFGEDPVLAGTIAAGYVKGIQSQQVAACPKHLALNNQEICRTVGSSNIDERTLRELYLRSFDIAVREARPWMMMSSYNRINGVYASQCGHTQQDVIKDIDGFDGVMVSDWGGVHDTYQPAMNGLDLEMGSSLENQYFDAPLRRLVEQGDVPMAVIDEKVRRILRLILRTKGLHNHPIDAPKGEVDTARNHRESRELAEDGMVLLQNDKSFLPLNPNKLKNILVLGPNADVAHNLGRLQETGGSGAVHPAYEVTPLEGIRKFLGNAVQVDFLPAVEFDDHADLPAELLPDGLKLEYFESLEQLLAGAKPIQTEVASKPELYWGAAAAAGVAQVGGLSLRTAPRHGMFALRIKGTLKPSESGPARLSYNVQGLEAEVYLDGKPVLSGWHEGLTAAEYRFDAKKGHAYRLEIRLVRQNPGDAMFRLFWKQNEELRQQEALAAAHDADAVIFIGGTTHAYDKECLGYYNPPNADKPDLELPCGQATFLTKLAQANPRTAVVLVNGSPISVEPWADQVPAILEAWYGGQEAGTAIARVLFGATEAGGRLSCTFGRQLADYACHANGSYPGDRDPAFAQTNYLEGVFIGYRHFDRDGIEPRFPFGFGLSYTTFRQKLLKVTLRSTDIIAEVSVTNTGKRAGSQVVQVYAEECKPTVPRPPRELVGYAKLRLEPGETRTATIRIPLRALAYFDVQRNAFVVNAGKSILHFGTSSREFFAQKTIVIPRPHRYQ